MPALKNRIESPISAVADTAASLGISLLDASVAIAKIATELNNRAQVSVKTL